MQQWWQQKWAKYLGIALLIILFLASIYWIGIRKGKTRKYTAELPNGGSGIPVTTTTTGEKVTWNPEPLAKEGYDVMNGFFSPFFETRRVEWYGKMLSLTDDQLVAVYNAFNQLYISKGNGTLRDWINDEYNIENSQGYVELLVRLDKLSLVSADPKDK